MNLSVTIAINMPQLSEEERQALNDQMSKHLTQSSQPELTSAQVGDFLSFGELSMRIVQRRWHLSPTGTRLEIAVQVS